MSEIFFGMVVWGEAYIDDFVRLCLPSLLGDGNIDGKTVPVDTPFVIMTTPEDWERLCAAPLFGLLQERSAVEFRDLSPNKIENKYRRTSQAQHELLCSAEASKYIVLVYPDVIWSAGGLKYSFTKLAEGAKAVFAPGPTVSPASAENLLNRLAGPDGQKVLACSVPAAEMVATCLEHYHPMWDGFDWDKGSFTDSPACLKWDVSENTWLIRCLHLHPVALRVQPDNPLYFAEIEISLDGEYAPRLFDDLDDIHFATDSDQFALLSLREHDTPPLPVQGAKAKVSTVSRWAERHTSVVNKMMMDVAFCWHAGPVDSAAWARTLERSDAIIRQIQFRLSVPDIILKGEDPVAYTHRTERAFEARRWRSPKIGLTPTQLRARAARPKSVVVQQALEEIVWRLLLLCKQTPIGRYLRKDPRLAAIWMRIRTRVTAR